MTIPIYNSDARRRIRDSVHFTENFSRDNREKLRRGADTPCVVVITKTAIAQGDIGPCYRATGSAFDSAMTPLTEEIEAWNPGPALEANTRVVIEPVALHGVGTMWGIVAPFSGGTTTVTGMDFDVILGNAIGTSVAGGSYHNIAYSSPPGTRILDSDVTGGILTVIKSGVYQIVSTVCPQIISDGQITIIAERRSNSLSSWSPMAQVDTIGIGGRGQQLTWTYAGEFLLGYQMQARIFFNSSGGYKLAQLSIYGNTT